MSNSGIGRLEEKASEEVQCGRQT